MGKKRPIPKGLVLRAKKKPTGLGFESGGLQERIDAGGSISSLSNVLFP